MCNLKKTQVTAIVVTAVKTMFPHKAHLVRSTSKFWKDLRIGIDARTVIFIPIRNAVVQRGCSVHSSIGSATMRKLASIPAVVDKIHANLK